MKTLQTPSNARVNNWWHFYLLDRQGVEYVDALSANVIVTMQAYREYYQREAASEESHNAKG